MNVHTLIAELQAELPTGSAMTAAQQHALLGGPIGKVVALITDLQAGNWKAAWQDFKDLGDLIIGVVGTATDGGGLQFAQQSAALNINWANIFAILAKLLPLLLAGGAGA